MGSATTPEHAEAARRVQRWRRAFLAYAVLLTVGTHWPKLRLTSEIPITDKTAHLAAFALLAVLLWRTRWFRSRWIAVVLAAAWAALDEWSQAIPVLQRHATWHDLLANVLGALVAGAWLWALRPVGGAANRMRLALHECAFDRLLLTARPLVPLGGVLAACLLPVLLVRPFLLPETTGRVMLLAGAAWILASAWIVLDAWRRECEHLATDRSCLACGAAAGSVAFDAEGRGSCTACGSPLHAAQWTDPAPPPPGTLLALIRWPVAVVVAIVLLIAGGLAVAPHAYALALEHDQTARPAVRLARLLGTMPSPVSRAIDLALGLVLFAVAMRLYRARLARFFDRAAQCRRCGHDLRATPTVQGIGVCGECGTEFVTLEPPP